MSYRNMSQGEDRDPESYSTCGFSPGDGGSFFEDGQAPEETDDASSALASQVADGAMSDIDEELFNTADDDQDEHKKALVQAIKTRDKARKALDEAQQVFLEAHQAFLEATETRDKARNAWMRP